MYEVVSLVSNDTAIPYLHFPIEKYVVLKSTRSFHNLISPRKYGSFSQGKHFLSQTGTSIQILPILQGLCCSLPTFTAAPTLDLTPLFRVFKKLLTAGLRSALADSISDLTGLIPGPAVVAVDLAGEGVAFFFFSCCCCFGFPGFVFFAAEEPLRLVLTAASSLGVFISLCCFNMSSLGFFNNAYMLLCRCELRIVSGSTRGKKV